MFLVSNNSQFAMLTCFVLTLSLHKDSIIT